MKKELAAIALLLSAGFAEAAILKGRITDKANGEPLMGAAIVMNGTTHGTISDFDGNYELTSLPGGQVTVTISYVSFQPQSLTVNFASAADEKTADIQLMSEDRQIGEVAVVARKNLENENLLMQERKSANIAIENIGAREMSAKGISNVQEGVKKLSGISIASAGQLIVRGLGDRYSTTTLNGLPIASPNPDNKLIPLDMFPSQTVKNITVSKVFEASSWADYSGAHVDIGTKENTGNNFFNISVSGGGRFNTVFADFYNMDRGKSMWGNNGLADNVVDMSKSDFRQYVLGHDVFGSTFEVSRRTARPDIGGGISMGRTIGNGPVKLSLLAAGTANNTLRATEDAFVKTINDNGEDLNRFDYDSYDEELETAALGTAALGIGTGHRIVYTAFFARNATDCYTLRQGIDYEGHELIGSNSVSHIYSLFNQQLTGRHDLTDRLTVDWSGSYGMTKSDEPDRRQVMYITNSGDIKLFKLNQQETMRYFGTLDENELVGDVKSEYRFANGDKMRVGVSYKDKRREYRGLRFYYDVSAVDQAITDIFTPDFLRQPNIAAGLISVDRQKQPKDSYEASHDIVAAFAEADFTVAGNLLVNLGLRYEHSRQTVDYFTDGGSARTSRLTCDDIFPAINIKYSPTANQNIRFSLSRTVTRPSFIEMSPFLYQESYGAAQIRGNDELQNGYNYNVDLRYERITPHGDMLALTAYYKFLQDPIERIQRLAGGSAVHSFQNSDQGTALGIEAEARKMLGEHFSAGANFSLMYTDVKLPEGGGAYTNTQRALQGASPYLANADLTYKHTSAAGNTITAALLYNLQGPRIDAVGISGLGDVEQQAVHTLDFNMSYKFAGRMTVKAKLSDILNLDMVYKQDVPNTGRDVTVQRYPDGIGASIGFSVDL